MSDKPVAYKIVPINMVTTSEKEREKWIKAGHEVEALYPSAAYEALQKDLDIFSLRNCKLRMDNEALKAENEAQAKRIAELEQKEKVLDRLISEFEGKHKFVGTMRVHKKLPLDLGRMENAATICAEHVDVFQWVFLSHGEPSFKQAVMNLLPAKNGDSK